MTDPEFELIEEQSYNDAIAARADAFGELALKMEGVTDDKVRELCFQMLRQLIRSIKTQPDAELTSIAGGKS